MMTFYHPILVFWVILIPLALLPACTGQPNYAPVTISGQTASTDTGKPAQPNNAAAVTNNKVNQNRDVIQSKRAGGESSRKYYFVKEGDTLYSIGISSGYGHERLALWNQLSAPYHILPGQQLKLFEPAVGDKITYKNHIPIAEAAENERPPKPVISKSGRKDVIAKPVFTKHKPEISVAKIANNHEKKSIISTDNKKMLKLNFAWPIRGRVSRNFNQSNKKGIDIAGKIGQKVRAAEAGRIAYSGQGLIGFGNLIIIKHNDLYLTAYANNSHLLVKEGEQVEKGQVIAQVGKTLSKKAALHFEIRKNGKPVNPLKLLPKSDKTL